MPTIHQRYRQTDGRTDIPIVASTGLVATLTPCKNACILKHSAKWPFKVVQGSMIFAAIESAYATSYWSSVVTLVLFHSNFRGVPLGLDCRCCVFDSEDPKLIIRVITFELVQPMCPRYLNVTDGQTDRQTYGRLTIAIPS